MNINKTVKTGTIDIRDPEGAEVPYYEISILGIINNSILKTILIPIVIKEKNINLQKSKSLTTSVKS